MDEDDDEPQVKARVGMDTVRVGGDLGHTVRGVALVEGNTGSRS